MQIRIRLLLASLITLTHLSCGHAPADLRIANKEDVAVLDPHLATGSAEARILSALFVGLTRLDSSTLEVLPGLAQSWHRNDDATKWVFQLREKLHWSDGSSLTPHDITSSWERLLSPSLAAPYRSWLLGAEWTTHSDSIEIHFSSPQWNLPEKLAWPALAPLPPSMRDGSMPALSFGSISSGPYRLIQRVIRDRIRLEANPFYWEALDSLPSTVDVLTIESPFTALNLFLSEQIHYSPVIPPLSAKALTETQRQAFRPEPQFSTCFLRFQLKDSPFADKQLRKALVLATDSEALCRSLGSACAPSNSYVPPTLNHYSPVSFPAFSPSQAREALNKSQYDPSVAPPLELLFPSSDQNRILAEFLQDQWQKHLGIKVRLAHQEWKTFLAEQQSLNYQISRSSWVGDYLDPLTFLEIFHSKSQNNRTGWQSEKYDSFLQQAQTAASPELRLQYLKKAEDLLVEAFIVLPLYHDLSLELISTKLSGWNRNPRGWVDWSQIQIKDTP